MKCFRFLGGQAPCVVREFDTVTNLSQQGRNTAPLGITNSTRQALRPTIVDVDDKNCLAQLTVVLKLNQGVRQRLYIIVGVLFPACRQAGFVLSFAQAKERT